MKEYGGDTLGRETDFIACNHSNCHRVLDERRSIAPGVFFKSLICNGICLSYQGLSCLVISWEQFVYSIHISPFFTNFQSYKNYSE